MLRYIWYDMIYDMIWYDVEWCRMMSDYWVGGFCQQDGEIMCVIPVVPHQYK
jgi:hypothetical protein